MKTCKVCGEQKRRSEMGRNDTCLNCIEKGWDEYYQKKSKEELISMCKSERKESKSSNKMIVFGVLGVVIVSLFIKYLESPNALEGLNFLEASGNVISQIITALGFCLLVGIATIICYIVYTAIISKLPDKIPKWIVAILLCITAFVVYVCFLIV